MEVGTLSRQGTGPYATHYRQPFAFSTFPYPLIQQVALRLPCPHTEACGRTVGLTTFPDLPTFSSAHRFLSIRVGLISPGADPAANERPALTDASLNTPFGYGLSADLAIQWLPRFRR